MKIHLKKERGGNNDYLISIFFSKIIMYSVVCIVLYLMHKPKVFTDFLMIDVMELLFLIELICTIFIDLKGKK